MRIGALLLASLHLCPIFLVSSCASGDHKQFDPALSRVRDADAYNEEIVELAESSEELTASSIATIGYPESVFRLLHVAYEPKGRVDTAVLIIGGVHGNEPAGSEFALRLVRGLASGAHLYPHARIDILPMVNPWGWEHDSRYNYEGKDINRDFASCATLEAQAVRSFLDDKSYDLVIDHHEDRDASGVYLYQYGRRDQDVCRSVLADIQSAGFELEQDVNMIILKTKNGLIDAPMWGLRYMRLTGQLSVTNYIRLENSREVFTVETPTRLLPEERVYLHEMAFTSFMDAFVPEGTE